MFPQEHMIMPEPQQQQQVQQPQLRVNYPINNQPNVMYQQFQQQPYTTPNITPAPNVGQRVTNPGNQQGFVNAPQIKKVDFNSNL